MDPSTLIDIALKSIPQVAVMISGILAIWLSRGTWAKADEKRQRTLFSTGMVAFLLGLVLTILVAIFQMWRDYAEYISPILATIWTATLSIISWTTALLLVLIITCAILFRWWKELQTEKGYKIQADGVVRTARDYPEANILVEKIGKGSFYCLARLVSVKIKSDGNDSWQSIDVKEINPDGDFLVWNGNQAQPKLVENVPQTIELIDVNHNRTCFNFYGSQYSYHESPPLKNGTYKIEIDILRVKNSKQIKVLSFIKELIIASRYRDTTLTWIR